MKLMPLLPTAGITIQLPFATPSQNVYQRWHWRERNRYRDTVTSLIRAHLLATLAALPRVAPYRVGLEVLRQGLRDMDYGNLVGGCKPVLDALVKVGVLYDDAPKWVREHYDQERVPRGRERTRLWAYPAIES